MKTEIIDSKIKKDCIYPLVARSIDKGYLVLFTSEKAGSVITENDTLYLGFHQDTWISCFSKISWEILDDVTIRFSR